MNVNKSLDKKTIVVAVIDGTKARFLTLELEQLPDDDFGPNLMEKKVLYNPNNELSGQELWANTKTGRNRGGAAAQAHSYDDHRQNHIMEFERRFAQTISHQIISFIQICQARYLVLVAEPQILGFMREALMPILPKNIELSELAKDLCKFKAKELHEYLADKELLPARKNFSPRQ
jgi:protein required for attachment to host cells